MPKETLIYIIVGIIFLPVVIIAINRHNRIKKDSEAIKIGMNLLDVKHILGEPDRVDSTGNIMTCLWNIRDFPRVGRIYKRIIVFKDGNVVSISNP